MFKQLLKSCLKSPRQGFGQAGVEKLGLTTGGDLVGRLYTTEGLRSPGCSVLTENPVGVMQREGFARRPRTIYPHGPRLHDVTFHHHQQGCAKSQRFARRVSGRLLRERYPHSRIAIALRVARKCCQGDASHLANGPGQVAEIIIPADARRVIASGRERSFEHGDDVSLRHAAAKRYQLARALSRASSILPLPVARGWHWPRRSFAR